MHVFVYEYLTGGGTFHESSANPCRQLAQEGLAMVTAVLSDFASIPDIEVTCLWDDRLPLPANRRGRLQPVGSARDETRCFREYAMSCDATLIIAPEMGQRLLRYAEVVEQVGGTLLGPDPAFIRLASNKTRTCQHLDVSGVSVPRTCSGSAVMPSVFAGPVVVKPNDGVGSVEVRLYGQVTGSPAGLDHSKEDVREYCVQEYCRGRAASVAVLFGHEGPVVLPACWQDVQPPRFQYSGGALILEAGPRRRASRLVTAAARAMPATRGWVGFDLVLGDEAGGQSDYVIEVNPRVTTSYIGLRTVAEQNLAAAMIEVLCGRVPDLSFRFDPLEFSASGEVLAEGARGGTATR